MVSCLGRLIHLVISIALLSASVTCLVILHQHLSYVCSPPTVSGIDEFPLLFTVLTFLPMLPSPESIVYYYWFDISMWYSLLGRFWWCDDPMRSWSLPPLGPLLFPIYWNRLFQRLMTFLPISTTSTSTLPANEMNLNWISPDTIYNPFWHQFHQESMNESCDNFFFTQRNLKSFSLGPIYML